MTKMFSSIVFHVLIFLSSQLKVAIASTILDTPTTGQTCRCVYPKTCYYVHGRYTGDNSRRENIALNKRAEMSSTYSNHRGLSGPASKANDGNTDTIYRPLNETGPNCIHTKESSYEWWQVDLGAVYTISDITIYPRYNFTDRMSDVMITVDGIVCFTIPRIHSTVLSNLLITCASPLSGRIIKLSRKDWLNICEVQVWVCIQGYYGVDCSQKCGNCTQGMSCNTRSGVCQNGCEDGFIPPFCKKKCSPGTWGRQCMNMCGKCNGSACRHDTGSCETGGIPGYDSDKCTVLLDQKSGMVENRAVVGAIIGGSVFVGVSILTAVMIWVRWSRFAQDGRRRRSNENNPQCTDAGTNEIFATWAVNNDYVERLVEGATLYTSLKS